MSETAKPSGVFLAGTPTALALFGALGVGAAATPEDRLGSLFAELRASTRRRMLPRRM
jgi:hypothetical protein